MALNPARANCWRVSGELHRGHGSATIDHCINSMPKYRFLWSGEKRGKKFYWPSRIFVDLSNGQEGVDDVDDPVTGFDVRRYDLRPADTCLVG